MWAEPTPRRAKSAVWGASRPGWEGRQVRIVISRSERARLTVRFLVPLLGPGLPGLSRSRRCHLPDVRAGLAWWRNPVRPLGTVLSAYRRNCPPVPGCALGRAAVVACVPCGRPQGERDDRRKQGLNPRRQPLDHAQVTAAASCCDQEPARQPGEDHGHRRAAVDTDDPRLRWRAPGDKDGPDRRRDGAAHREGKMAGRRAGGRFRSGGDAESRKPSQDQQDARRHAHGSQARAGRDLTAAHQQQGRGHYPPVGS